MFSAFPKTNASFSFTFILSSADAFNLDQSKNLLFDKELKNKPIYTKLVRLFQICIAQDHIVHLRFLDFRGPSIDPFVL